MPCLGEQLGMEFTPEEIATCLKKGGLLSMELELSRICDLRCVYCYASSGVPLKNELTLVEIKNIIDQAAELGAKKIIVLGGGEPMLYPHIFEVIEYICDKGLAVDLFTNGLSITQEVAERLHSLQVDVVLKMNSKVPEIQDYLAGRAGTSIAIQKAFVALTDAGYPSATCALGIETIICQQNYEELPELWRWARYKGISPYIEAMTMQGRATEHDDLEVSEEQIRSLFEELSRIDREEFSCNWTAHPPLAASHCARHEYSCTVTSIGEVQPCPGVNISAGSIRKQSLAEILSGTQVFQDLRNIRTKIKGKCATCNLGEVCYGCRGHAYQVTEDYLAEDPLCWLNQTEDIK